MLVHGTKPDIWSWFPLFSVCYFHTTKDGNISRSKNQAKAMDGIAIGHSPTYNALLVYIPRNKNFYEPETYSLDPYRVPGSIYPNVKYYGELFCFLAKDGKPPQDKVYPPGTRIVQEDPATRSLRPGTVMDITLVSSQPVEQQLYLIQFDGFTTISVTIIDMPKFIPKPPFPLSTATENNRLLPDFLQFKTRITYKHKGQYY